MVDVPAPAAFVDERPAALAGTLLPMLLAGDLANATLASASVAKDLYLACGYLSTERLVTSQLVKIPVSRPAHTT